MALVEPFIFQIAGYQNSGKTTVVSKLVKRLKNDEGVKVAVIKHHGHGGKPDVLEGKDSSKHLEAGAVLSIVEGAGRLMLQAEQPSWTLSKEIELARFFQPDLILIEGYKKESYPKLLLLRDKRDLELLQLTDHIVGAFIWESGLKELIQKDYSLPCFSINDPEGIDWLARFVLGHLKQ